ncbi:MAG: 2-oxo acid dehydrogenase subunit E2 [Deltaproteobacteria bacterium]|jgi:pyruvate dehydrogenase E2 component (dihydrolipoamide acetyltransferase)|nr:2-oxo acid dehydrogenase subunit E2 [Deltaproteobacteria bacterium]
MAVNVLMPKLGLTMETGVIAHWKFKHGDAVKAGDILYQVETDKLTNDITAEIDGVLHIKFPEGSVVPVAQVVGAIAAPGEAVSFDGAPAGEKTPPAAPVAANQPAGRGAGGAGKVRATPKAKKLAAERGIDLSGLTGTGPDGMIAVKDLDKAPRIKTTPLAAKVADGLGVDLASVSKDGRIFKADVLAAHESAQVPALHGPAEVQAKVRRMPMSAMRQAIARNMSASWAVSPMVHYDLRADVTALGELKKNLCLGGKKISYTDILIKAVSHALKEHPLVNAGIDGNEIVLHDYVNMGVAVALPAGLIVPVIKGVEGKGIGEVSDELRELAEKALQGKLVTEEFSGGTFTISNLGMFGIESFTPIINQPESAILGVNAIVKTAVEAEGQIVMRPLMNLSLTADHRLVDGAEGARFMARLREIIENPWYMLM